MKFSGRIVRKRDGGFTLPELMVVLGIITVIIAILLPALARARLAAQKIQCANNIRQLVLAADFYASGSRGIYPLELRNMQGYTYIYPGWFREDMYIAMGFSDPTKTPFSSTWICPSNPDITFITNQTGAWPSAMQWHFPAPAYQTDPYDATLLQTCYMYMGNGVGFAANSLDPAAGSLKQRPRRQSDVVLPLFADQVNYNNSNVAWIINHPGKTIGSVEGMNEGFTDGHVEWVNGAALPNPLIPNPPYAGGNAIATHSAAGPYYASFWW